MGWFKKRIDIARPGLAEFERAAGFGLTYERQRLPDPGAGVYSYETLLLDPKTQIGPGVAVRHAARFTQQPLYTGQAIPLTGIPTVAGQLVHVPLMPEPEYNG